MGEDSRFFFLEESAVLYCKKKYYQASPIKTAVSPFLALKFSYFFLQD